MKPLPTAPQSPVEIIGSGFGLGIGVYPKILMATSLIAFLELLPTMNLALHLGDVEITPEEQLRQQLSSHQLLVQLASILLVLLVHGMLIARLDHFARGHAVEYRDEWKRGLRAFLPLVGALILSLLIVCAGFLLSLLIGQFTGMVGGLLMGESGIKLFSATTAVCIMLYMVVYLLFIQYCIVLEARGPIDAVNASFRLVLGRWWRTFAVLLLLFLMVIMLGIVLGVFAAPFVLSVINHQTGRSLFILGVAQMIITAFVSPVFFAILYMLYNDLKLRAAGV